MPSAGTVLDHVLEDARKRLDISDYYLDREIQWVAFPETWPSTALGFGGVGGQAITTAQTYVVWPGNMPYCALYWGGQFAKLISRDRAQEILERRSSR
jgi:hypothetical protein